LALAGELPAWVADECRLGNTAAAWATAEEQVLHGPYSGWMAQNEPDFIQQLAGDLVRWGYCSSGP
jgi:hypothetical protein